MGNQLRLQFIIFGPWIMLISSFQIKDIFGPENGYATKTTEIPIPDQVSGGGGHN